MNLFWTFLLIKPVCFRNETKHYYICSTHFGLVITQIWVNIGSGNTVLSDGSNVDKSSVKSSDINLMPIL